MITQDENKEEYEVVQLRVRNRLLASRLRKAQKGSDENFAALCAVGTAQAALFEIWAATDLSCEAEDYDIIVEYVLTAIDAHRESLVSHEE